MYLYKVTNKNFYVFGEACETDLQARGMWLGWQNKNLNRILKSLFNDTPLSEFCEFFSSGCVLGDSFKLFFFFVFNKPD